MALDPSPKHKFFEFMIKGGASAMRLATDQENSIFISSMSLPAWNNGPFSDIKAQFHSAFCDVDGVSCKIESFIVVLRE